MSCSSLPSILSTMESKHCSCKLLTPIIIMNKLKCGKRIFDLAIALFVVWQSQSCILRYQSKPKATEIKISNGVGELFPEFNICPIINEFNDTNFDSQELAKCGLSEMAYKMDHNWIGNCSDPQILFGKISTKIEDFVSLVTIVGRYSEENEYITPKMEHWNIKDDPRYGRCFALQFQLSQEISRLKFQFVKPARIFFNSPGIWQSTDTRVYHDVAQNNRVSMSINYEVFHMLDYAGKKCNDNPDYSRDECNEQKLIQYSMEKINCTWPFSSHKNHICVNQNDAKMAHDFGMAHHRRKPITCLDPCHYLQVNSYETGSFASQSPQISFKFPENMRITRAYYSYQRINLIAEIGGYVGLFLGVSVIQITNVLDHASRWISSKVEFVAALSTSRITH